MNLIKTSFYTSISTAITFLSGFIIVKFVAVKIGPTGIALVGQFQNSTTIFTLIATAAVTIFPTIPHIKLLILFLCLDTFFTLIRLL